jgi:SAM-dependent methyltransferase
MDRHHWTLAEVADVMGPSANVRNYLEQRDVRRCLTTARQRRPIARACDVGCGYGRLTMVLSEFAEDVSGFEREPAFVEIAQRLRPAITFHQVDTLEHLPRPDASIDFAMIFTVLQHMPDANARAVVEEIKRIARGGIVLVTEETDVSLRDAEGVGVTVGRSVGTYAEWMAPFEPILQFTREIEPGYPRPDVGTYMLFADGG